jgi:hypothetical protein
VRPIRRVVIHQTDTADATLESIRRFHVEVMGWRDIGYHQVILRDGEVQRGRPDDAVGAHVKGHNADSIGICLVGAGRGLPVGIGYITPEQWESLLRLCERYHRAYGIPWENFVGHREFPGVTKICPGFEVAVLRKALRSGPAKGVER